MLQRKPITIILTFCTDMAMLLIALLIAQLLRLTIALGPNIPNVEEFPAPIAIVSIIVWLGALIGQGVYTPVLTMRRWAGVSRIMGGSVIAMLVIAGVLYFSYRDVSRFLVFYFYGAGVVLLILWRASLTWLMHPRRTLRRVVVVGTNNISDEVANVIRHYAWAGLTWVGFITTDDTMLSQPRVLGHSNYIGEIITTHTIDEVIIALPSDESASLYEVVNTLQKHAVQIRIVPDYFSLVLHRAKADMLGHIPLISLRDSALSGYQRLQKRLFDLLISIPALIILMPVMLIIAWRIKRTSAGNAIYKQMRVGENGRIFVMYKFRTMVMNADKGANPYDKQPSDPRVTPFGRFLRRTSLDELPQLINVIKGDMSLVGPRPEIPALVENYADWQRKRFAVPQGMTGWWQVNGRSDKPMYLHTEDDLYYIQNYSLWLDIRIIFRTISSVFIGRGAF